MSEPKDPGPTPLPPGWRAPSGYSNAIAAVGRQIHVAGQVGWDPASETFASDDFVAQTRQALRNLAAVLAAAGAEPRHLVRLTWFITDRQAYLDGRREIGAAYREILGRHFPAMTLVVVTGLLEAGAKVEIEATAVVPA
jgi:enamine deaminase RidA (YjgF/YER057c/UK114 family)